MSKELTQSINLSKDSETEGFDLQAGRTWIYPTNYPVRDYQYNIIQKALLNNTLVSLPTGLGKTFIAAVLMYNFFRWYPLGKVIFMAPTRPLVKQQIDACYDIMAIPKDATVELTGTKMATVRKDVWREKRVFFITPQILQNDLDTIAELGSKIKCVVFDEAHRARGNHAYCEVIRKLIPHTKFFRVLALSATPGSTVHDVLEVNKEATKVQKVYRELVVQNLLISHLEFRTEESLDVHPYVYERKLITVIVPLGDKLQKIRDDYLQVLEYYSRILIKYKVLHGNCGNLTKGKIFMTMKDFQQRAQNRGSNYAEIMKTLHICITLYHAFELLIRHGLRSFVTFFNEHIDKPLLRGNSHLIKIIRDVRDYLGPEANIEQLPDGSYPEIPATTKFGHPKFYKLRDLLVSHFTEANDSSRVIVFFEYRHSVKEAYALLIQARPLLKPRIFLGQGPGMTQRMQLNVVKSFQRGECNILLSTCIGEEGLDVGDVDLIICFDISSKSPIRMVQRMGRTGRKKAGCVIVLVTEGKEEQLLKDCLIHKNNIDFNVLSSKELARGLSFSSPRLVPLEISPKCEKIYITVRKPILTKSSSLKDMFNNFCSSPSEPTFDSDLKICEIKEMIPKTETLWNKGNGNQILIPNPFAKKIEKQRCLHMCHLIKHSEASEILVNLLRLADSKRFNIPVTQVGSFFQLSQNKKLKQSDIRNMFMKSQILSNLSQGTQASITRTSPAEKDSSEEICLMEGKELAAEISTYLSIHTSNISTKCRHCPKNFDCSAHNLDVSGIDFHWNQIDDSVFLTASEEDINLFTEQFLKTKQFKESCSLSNCSELKPIDPLKIIHQEKVKKTCINSDVKSNQPGEYITDSNINTDSSFRDVSSNHPGMTPVNLPIDNMKKKCENDCETLSFFKLTHLTELFSCETKISNYQTNLDSPNIIENSLISNKSMSNHHQSDNYNQSSEYNLSPVLFPTEGENNVGKKSFKQKLFKDPVEDNFNRRFTSDQNISINIIPSSRPNLRKLSSHNQTNWNYEIGTCAKYNTNTIELSSTPKNNNFSYSNSSTENSRLSLTFKNLQHAVGGNNEPNKISNNRYKEKANQNNIDVNDICDLSIFGLPTTNSTVVNLSSSQSSEFNCENNVEQNTSRDLSRIISVSSSFDVNDFYTMDSLQNTSNGKIIEECSYVHRSSLSELQDGLNKSTVVEQQQSNDHIERNTSKTFLNNLIDSPTSKICNQDMQANKSCSVTQATITQILDIVNLEENNTVSIKQLSSLAKKENMHVNVLSDDIINKENYLKNKQSIEKKKISVNTQPSTSKLSFPSNQINIKSEIHKLWVSTDSDDEFNETPVKSKNPGRTKFSLRDKIIKQPSKRYTSQILVKKKKKSNPFIDDEAELSKDHDINVTVDEDELNESFDSSFISDESQDMDT